MFTANEASHGLLRPKAWPRFVSYLAYQKLRQPNIGPDRYPFHVTRPFKVSHKHQAHGEKYDGADEDHVPQLVVVTLVNGGAYGNPLLRGKSSTNWTKLEMACISAGVRYVGNETARCVVESSLCVNESVPVPM